MFLQIISSFFQFNILFAIFELHIIFINFQQNPKRHEKYNHCNIADRYGMLVYHIYDTEADVIEQQETETFAIDNRNLRIML